MNKCLSCCICLALVMSMFYIFCLSIKRKRNKNIPHLFQNLNPYNSAPPYFEEYAKKHKQWLRTLTNNSKGRALVYSQHPSGGMGNKLRTLVGVTFLAMMTDRAILIRNWKTFDSYYASPLSTLEAPSNLIGGKRYYDYITCLSENQIKDLSTTNDDIINYLTCCDLTDLFLQFGNYGDKAKKYGLVTDRSNNKIEKQGNEIRYFLYRFFYKPSKIVTDRMLLITNTFAKDKLLIGLHFRTNHRGWNDRGVTFLNETQIENATLRAFQISQKLKKVQWYISTDDNEILKKYKAKYPNYVVNDVREKAHSRGSSSRVTDAYVFSIVESHILASSDILFLTASSSFSGMAYFKSFLSVLEFLDENEKKSKYNEVIWI